MVDIAIMGYGIVGSGVAHILKEHKDSIAKRANNEVNIKYILDIRDFEDSEFSDKFIKDFNIILNDPDVKIVVETIGGLDPAYEFVKKSLEAYKSVVTSNKELVAAKGLELIEIAKQTNVNFLFEASVGGGIPIIRPLSQCLVANDVLEIGGILNGTTNFILTKMIREGMQFDEALKLAQDNGFVESNPSADIDGHDACRKICILASLAFGKHVYPENVHTEGISNITKEDVEYAIACGGVIKLIGKVQMMENSRIQISVEPMIVSNDSQLSSVDDVFNAILVRGDSIGDVVFYGQGAGRFPTASAVVADVIDCVKHFKARKYLYWEKAEHSYVMPYSDTITAVLVRLQVEDKGYIKKLIDDAFTSVKYVKTNKTKDDELVFITPISTIKSIKSKLNDMLDCGVSIKSFIRLSNL